MINTVLAAACLRRLIRPVCRSVVKDLDLRVANGTPPD
ncbi:hypothetical protein FRUB_03270 [Fimbriiglobus ruber]|uniref:Uncharacterized protein n=1 Tax=Fimbriiglobus ruber TaxID=1908690 RepID=A0A225DQU7_9BACT|nr:hypothetical protein FRUB_03270 [Fimbriiglobus ruber]